MDPHAFAFAGDNRDVIWSEDFSDGFNSGWTSFGLGGRLPVRTLHLLHHRLSIFLLMAV